MPGPNDLPDEEGCLERPDRPLRLPDFDSDPPNGDAEGYSETFRPGWLEEPPKDGTADHGLPYGPPDGPPGETEPAGPEG